MTIRINDGRTIHFSSFKKFSSWVRDTFDPETFTYNSHLETGYWQTDETPRRFFTYAILRDGTATR